MEARGALGVALDEQRDVTPTESIIWRRVMRRAQTVTPDVARRLLAAFATLRDSFTDAELERLISTGAIDRLVERVVNDATFQTAMQPVRDAMRRNIIQSVATYAKTLPLPPSSIKSLVVSFDYLAPQVITAIRALETRVMTSLADDTRETVRAFVENGLRDGVGPKTIARNLRQVIGLGPTQLQEVANFRQALLGQNGRSVTNYAARNKVVDRLLAKGELTDEQVERYVEAYRKKRIAINAETIARTATLDAQKSAQHLAWQQASSAGHVDGGRLMKTWIGVMDSRERPTHVAMEGATIPWDALWPVDGGALTPGDGTFNCRCIARYFVAPA